MKNRKLLITSLALCSAVAVIGTTFAFYKISDSKKITIGGIETVTDVNYQILDAKNDGAEKFGYENTVINYSCNISGLFNEQSKFAQPFVGANLGVTVTGLSEQIASAKLTIGGYKVNYWNNQVSDKELTYSQETSTWTGSFDTYIFVDDKTTLDVVEQNTVNLAITLNKTYTAEEYINTLAEKDLKVSFTLGKLSSAYQVSYVMSDLTGWTKSEDYEMVANLGADKYEWAWFGSLPVGTTVKCFNQNGTWSKDNQKTTTEIKGVYWDGSSQSNNTFDEVI